MPFSLDYSSLIGLFYDDIASLGRLTVVSCDQMPAEYQRLLVHEEHMTVAMEAFHESLVDVDVVATNVTNTHYARKSLLRRQRDRSVVQFGIMRVNLACLSQEVRREIADQSRPLGRILVRYNVLRTVHLDLLWKVEPGSDLCRLLDLGEPQVTYGRTATIALGGEPAVEVLEIVAPL